MMLTACEKAVTIWDLVTVNVMCTLKAHRDEVRTMHIVDDLLFTGGKGLANSGSLLMWDLRNLDPNKPQEQKERNQDIFNFVNFIDKVGFSQKYFVLRNQEPSCPADGYE